MREIAPDREYNSRDNIGEEELVEDEEYSEWYDRILVRDDISEYSRWMDHILIVPTISEPDEYSPNLEYIGLFYHIEQY